MSHKLHIRYALIFGSLASFCYAITNILGKYATEEASPFFLLFFRFFLGLLFLTPFLRKENGLFKIPHPWLMLGRGFLSVLVFALILISLKYIPVANVVTLTLVYPLVLPLIARYYFHRAIPHSIYLGITLGFIGIIVLLHPSIDSFKLIPSLLSSCAGILIAFIFIFIRRMGRSASNLKILFDLYLIAIIFSLVPMILTWNVPTWKCWLALIGMAISGNFYQISLNYALKKASSVVVAPMMFSSVIMSILADFIIWNHRPSSQMLAGTSLIFLGVVITSIINYRHAEHLT